jgi:hypothetical protein
MDTTHWNQSRTWTHRAFAGSLELVKRFLLQLYPPLRLLHRLPHRLLVLFPHTYAGLRDDPFCLLQKLRLVLERLHRHRLRPQGLPKNKPKQL